MNFNVGGFSESLKCSYQQFCKQEAEGRDSSRRLLMKLKKFEAKAFDLVAQTQSAQQMRNQFEKMVMQQNPLFWAQLQRNIAIDMADFNLECPLSGCSGMKHTREMAVNTSYNSSTSEPHSLHEEGIWPHTPSPVTDMDIQQLSNGNTKHFKMCSSTPHHKDNREYQNMKRDRKKTNSNSVPTHKEILHIPSPQGSDKTKHSSTSILEIPHLTQNIITPQQVNQHVSASNAVPKATIIDDTSGMLPPPSTANSNSEPMNEVLGGAILGHYLSQQEECSEILSHVSVAEFKHPSTGTTEVLDTEPITCKPQDTNNDKKDVIKDFQSNTIAVDEIPQSPSPNKIKPFRLDSDSDCADDPISGPLSGKNVGDDDSDSFWN